MFSSAPGDFPDNEINQIALDWFVRREGGLSTTEEACFQQWLHAEPSHRDAYAVWEREDAYLGALPEEGIARLRSNIGRDRKQHESSFAVSNSRSAKLTWRAPRLVLGGMALAIAGVAILAWQVWWQPQFSEHYQTARGAERTISLADGSLIQLDTNTSLDVALYRGHRDVVLREGQALFEVAGDVARPFDIVAGPVRITVVGTRFSVRNTPDVPGREGVQVAVEKGIVKVGRGEGLFGGQQMIELRAGQQVSATTDGVVGRPTAVPPEGVAVWRDSCLSFADAELATVLAEFERYVDSGLRIVDPAVAKLRLTGTFDPFRLDNFRRTLPVILPVRLVNVEGRTEIVAR